MFSLSNLVKYIGSGKDAKDAEEVVITSGKFYLIRYKSKVRRLCLFNNAQLAIRKAGVEYQHQLIVSRLYDEGEEPDSDEEIDDEQIFLADELLKFHRSKYDGKDSFLWNDVQDAHREDYEFVVDDSKKEKISIEDVVKYFAMCAWERRNNRPYNLALEGEIKDIIESMADDTGDLADAINDLSVSVKKGIPEEEGIPEVNLPEAPSDEVKGTLIDDGVGELFIFDPHTSSFVFCEGNTRASVVKTKKFVYWMNVSSEKGPVITQLVEPNMNAIFNHDHTSLIWNYFDTNGLPYSFSIVFEDASNFSALHCALAQAAYETVNQSPWSKVGEAEKNYMLSVNQNNAEMDVESDFEFDQSQEDVIEDVYTKDGSVIYGHKEYSEDEDEKQGREESDEEDSQSDDEDESSPEDLDAAHWDSKHKNSKLAVGYNHDRSFVLRGNQIGVFRHTDDDNLEFDTTINGIDDTKGNEFLPSNMMLHEQDQSMILSNPNQPNNLYRMDVEYGKVVDEWTVHEDIPTNIVVPDSKYAPTTSNKTLVGLSHNSIYRIDPRLPGQKCVDDEFKMYASKPNFTCAATTESGHIVVAGEKGTVQLFDRIGPRAKTALPALGDSIIGIDVTADGRYLVATCKTYLLLVDTKVQDDPKGRNGFQKSFPKDKKPVPKRLCLQPSHVVYMKSSNANSDLTFTPARFNTAPHDSDHAHRGERLIVTSSGQFVITWNLNKVLKTGRGDIYSIRKYPDNVVADNFKFGQDRSIIVTLPNDVTMIQRKDLQKPTRKSLAIQTPVRKLRSNNTIVNSPY
ncbi:Vacuolar import and degradation protein 27 [Mycoemilia scoparia]|uniref:Vacuolar import and degradation protein 27 n=1 Tax=Mycoemilia scoparia TaxID=417184 RepID=A0A9W8DR26_9FUNG|nr:Vacuolar import and degradation protein 27 [Mycoemilia scoparia]